MYTPNITFFLYIARLFEVNEKNLAYQYADKHFRNAVGDDVKKVDDGDDIDPKELMRKWGFKEKYIEILIDKYEYEDIKDWDGLDVKKLKGFGFADGAADKFVRKTKEYFGK